MTIVYHFAWDLAGRWTPWVYDFWLCRCRRPVYKSASVPPMGFVGFLTSPHQFSYRVFSSKYAWPWSRSWASPPSWALLCSKRSLEMCWNEGTSIWRTIWATCRLTTRLLCLMESRRTCQRIAKSNRSCWYVHLARFHILLCLHRSVSERIDG